eukprot:TRINITY_DN7594_c2_g1_i1.p1 TRINITY_DN7594_c2_g1~~TRINITY_DN7594_c2_g1_i1.p1  ORF type:complete len:247 (-),score=44.23 TRINITY_DN7594_c2_g1_i1:111-851(-)
MLSMLIRNNTKTFCKNLNTNLFKNFSNNTNLLLPSITTSNYEKITKNSISKLVEGNDNIQDPKFEQYKLRTHEPHISKKAFTYFVLGTAGFTYAIAARNSAIGLLDTMNASADVLAMANIEVDLSTINVGESKTFKWRGKPLMVRHRTQEEIDVSIKDDTAALRDPQKDEERVKNPNFLIVLGVCTHLGCVPIAYAGDWHGYFCPCHGSHYDPSGRIRKGPAPLNLEVPPYTFVNDETVLVGVDSL